MFCFNVQSLCIDRSSSRSDVLSGLPGILVYIMIQSDVAAEAGDGRDEANHVSTRRYGSCPKPWWLK